MIEGSNNSVVAPTPQTSGGTSYRWLSWSDGGAQSHNIVAATPTTYTATYEPAGAPTCPSGQYLAEYFANQTLSGQQVFTRVVGPIAHDWDWGSPGEGIGANGFSVRWTGRFDFLPLVRIRLRPVPTTASAFGSTASS